MKKWQSLIRVGLCLMFSTGVTTSFVLGQSDNSPRGQRQGGTVEHYEPRQVLPRPVRAITDPAIISAEESDVADNELIIGVVQNGKARAYPINQLTGPQREIINDELGGTPIAATW